MLIKYCTVSAVSPQNTRTIELRVVEAMIENNDNE